MKKYLRIGIVAVVIILSIVIWYRFYFVFGEGVKAGELNIFVKKGYVFKTYEGRLIQTGLKSDSPGTLQSNEFEFSVTNDSVAAVLERCSGKILELRYNEYLGTVPWRGMSKYVVFEVISVTDKKTEGTLPFY